MWREGLAALQRVGSSQLRDGTCTVSPALADGVFTTELQAGPMSYLLIQQVLFVYLVLFFRNGPEVNISGFARHRLCVPVTLAGRMEAATGRV